MPKHPEATPMYPCMMTPDDLRLVHDPNDERTILVQGRVRSFLSKLKTSLRGQPDADPVDAGRR